MPSFKKAHASLTLDTNEVSHKPHLEQCSLAGKRSGHPDGSIGIAVENWIVVGDRWVHTMVVGTNACETAAVMNTVRMFMEFDNPRIRRRFMVSFQLGNCDGLS